MQFTCMSDETCVCQPTHNSFLVFCGGVFIGSILLGYHAMSLGKWNLMFQEGLVVSSGKVQNVQCYYAVSKLHIAATQSYDTTSRSMRNSFPAPALNVMSEILILHGTKMGGPWFMANQSSDNRCTTHTQNPSVVMYRYDVIKKVNLSAFS